jgi:hypothetical protein
MQTQTYTKNITINYNGEPISLPVYNNGVDIEWLRVDPEWIPELREYLQDILDQFPKDFLETYYPLGYITTTYDTGNVTHIMIFKLRDMKTPLELTDTTKDEIIELFYDPNFSWPDKPILLQTSSAVIIINHGSY